MLDFDNGKELFESAKSFSEVARDMQPQAQLGDDTPQVRAITSKALPLDEEVPF